MMLKGQKVIITAGVTGIGKATLIGMAEHGASVVTFSRATPDSDRAKTAIEEAKKVGTGKFSHIQCDVSKEEEVMKAVDKAVDFLGGLDALVLCAGIETQTPAEAVGAEEMLNVYSVSVLGTAFVCKAAFPHLKEKGGSIITYSSYAGLEGSPSMPAYSAAKGGILGYSRVIAKDWAQYNIRVNMITPAIWSEMGHEWINSKSPEERKEAELWLKGLIPLGGTFGEPEDAANLNIFLASNMSRFITGQTIGVDGGMCFTR